MVQQLNMWAFILLLSVASSEEVRFNSVFEQRSDSTCGIASAASLASLYRGMDVTEESLLTIIREHRAADVETKRTISLYDLQWLLEYLGFYAAGFSLNYTQLVQAAAKYGPLICHLASDEGHFVLFFGEIWGFSLIGDPARGCIAVSKLEFISSWSHTALAVARPDRTDDGAGAARVLNKEADRLRTLISWGLR